MTKKEFEKSLRQTREQSHVSSQQEHRNLPSPYQRPFSTAKMVRFSTEATDTEIRDALRQWIDLLAADRYEDAYDMLFRFADDEMTPDLMRTFVRNHGLYEPLPDGRSFRVTPRAEAVQTRRRPHHEDIEWFDDGSGVAHFDLPLNGEWSTLTAIIDIVLKGDERVLRLNLIHEL